MTRDNAIEFQRQFFEEASELFAAKNKDYSGESDALDIFKKAAEIVGIAPEKVVLVLMAIKLLRTCNLVNSKKEPNFETLSDSVIDSINYHALFAMILAEKE